MSWNQVLKLFFLEKVLAGSVNRAWDSQKNNANMQCKLKNAIQTPPISLHWTAFSFYFYIKIVKFEAACISGSSDKTNNGNGVVMYENAGSEAGVLKVHIFWFYSSEFVFSYGVLL